MQLPFRSMSSLLNPATLKRIIKSHGQYNGLAFLFSCQSTSSYSILPLFGRLEISCSFQKWSLYCQRWFPFHRVKMVDLQKAWISHKEYTFPEIKENDLEERFTRGHGPGGQSVNKTSNCVLLKHKPTGIVIKCHETRSLNTNRQKAREKLQLKLDHHLHGDESFVVQQKMEKLGDKLDKKRRAKQRLKMKKVFKERRGVD